MAKRNWLYILARAAEIVASYDTGVTLRQLFYRLVSEGLIRNSQSDYTYLSRKVAEARRGGYFPDLVDLTREILVPPSFESPQDALERLAKGYRRDRLATQDYQLFIGAEKSTMQALLQRWYRREGYPILLLRGYASQSYIEAILDRIDSDPRPAVLIYAGDYDPTGLDIERDLEERTNGAFAEIRRVAVTEDQIRRMQLPRQPGKKSDPRSKGFRDNHGGDLFQVEVEAIPPDVLRTLYDKALTRYVAPDRIEEIVEREEQERAYILGL